MINNICSVYQSSNLKVFSLWVYPNLLSPTGKKSEPCVPDDLRKSNHELLFSSFCGPIWRILTLQIWILSICYIFILICQNLFLLFLIPFFEKWFYPVIASLESEEVALIGTWGYFLSDGSFTYLHWSVGYTVCVYWSGLKICVFLSMELIPKCDWLASTVKQQRQSDCDSQGPNRKQIYTHFGDMKRV